MRASTIAIYSFGKHIMVIGVLEQKDLVFTVKELSLDLLNGLSFLVLDVLYRADGAFLLMMTLLVALEADRDKVSQAIKLKRMLPRGVDIAISETISSVCLFLPLAFVYQTQIDSGHCSQVKYRLLLLILL